MVKCRREVIAGVEVENQRCDCLVCCCLFFLLVSQMLAIEQLYADRVRYIRVP